MGKDQQNGESVEERSKKIGERDEERGKKLGKGTKNGAKQLGKGMKNGVKKIRKAMKNGAIFFGKLFNKKQSRKKEPKKFVLASSGSGSRAFFGFSALIQGYKGGISDLLDDTDFIATNSGSSWL